MQRTRLSTRAVVLALLLGASSLLVAQEPPVVQQANPSATELMAKGRLDGTLAAENTGTGGWMAGGVASGLVLGLIGTGIIWAVAGSSDATVPPDRRLEMANQPPTYQQAYESGYATKIKSKRKGAALAGGLIGTAAWVLIFVSANSGS